MKIADVYSTYPEKKWVLAKVTKQNPETHEVEEIEPVLVSDDRNEVYDKISEMQPGSHVMTLYTGPILEEGEAFAF